MASKRKSRKTVRPVAGNAQQRLLGTVHQIWLAGLGAASKASQGAPRLLDELVGEGARVQAQKRGAAEKAMKGLMKAVNARVGEVRGQATDTLNGLEKMFQTRVQRALNQLGVPSTEEVEALSKRIDMLNGSIDKLAAARKVRARGSKTSVAAAAH
ncbi:MAG TPA: phasin family protein [Steroidobacteraceae bacterium]|nr:phasin family protein [Candidatus Dormibacteraeota bacterium]HYM26793.1 phasin family protein [Steroidobacteraceae bacterium]